MRVFYIERFVYENIMQKYKSDFFEKYCKSFNNKNISKIDFINKIKQMNEMRIKQ